MEWTKEKPVVEGWYWIWWGTPTDKPYCQWLEYFEPVRERGLREALYNEGEYTIDHPKETMYYGPITPPETPHG